MALLDSIQNGMARILPEKKPTLPMSGSAGIGSGGAVPFDDDVRIDYFPFLFFSFLFSLSLSIFFFFAFFGARYARRPSPSGPVA